MSIRNMLILLTYFNLWISMYKICIAMNYKEIFDLIGLINFKNMLTLEISVSIVISTSFIKKNHFQY